MSTKEEKVFDLLEEYEEWRPKGNRVMRFFKRLFGKDEEKERLNDLYSQLCNVVFADCPYIFHLDMFFKTQEAAELYCAENGIDLDWIE